MISLFNKAQEVFGRVCFLESVDDQTLEFVTPAGWRILCQDFDGNGQVEVFEVVDGIEEKTARSLWVDGLLMGYKRTPKGNMVPAERMAECIAAGH